MTQEIPNAVELSTGLTTATGSGSTSSMVILVFFLLVGTGLWQFRRSL